MFTTVPSHKRLVVRIDLFIAFLLLTLALLPRLIHLGELPYGFWLDEPDYALTGLSLFKEHLIVPFTMKAIDGQMTPLLYLIAFSVKTFGQTIFAVRFPTALIASLNIPVFYLVSRLWVKGRIAFIATLLFNFSYWHIVFSRIAFQAPLLILMELLVVGSLYKALKENELRYWLLSGVFLGLSLYTYTPARWFAVIVISSIIILKRYVMLNLFQQLTKIPNQVRDDNKKSVFLFLLSFFLAAAPLLAYTIRYPNDILFRLNKLSILKASEVHASVIGEFTVNTFKNVSMFWLIPDTNGRHNPAQTAALEPLTGLLFAAAIVQALVSKRKLHKTFIAFTFLLLLPAILSFEGKGGENQPHMLRTSGAIPFVYLSLALFLSWLLKQPLIRKRFSFILMATFLIGFINLHRYFAQALTPKLYYEMNVREATVGQLVAQTPTKTIILSPYFARVPQVIFLKGEKQVGIFDAANIENYLHNLSILLVLDVNQENKEYIELFLKHKQNNIRFLTTSWGTTETFVYERQYD